jgi:hypothetical protein
MCSTKRRADSLNAKSLSAHTISRTSLVGQAFSRFAPSAEHSPRPCLPAHARREQITS